MPILKREPEIFPPDLFGGEGESGGNRGGARAAGSGHPFHPAGAVGNGTASTNGHDHLPALGHGVHSIEGADGRAHGNGKGNGQAGGAWWVAHVRSRQEKRLGRHLRDQRVAYYLPQRERRVRRGGRWWSSFLPLFPGYLFFHGTTHQRLVALRSNLIVTLLGVEDEALLEEELRAIWRLQHSGAPLVPHPYLGVGDAVEVVHGPFEGYRGRVLREKGAFRLVVSITLLRKSVATELDREVLAPDRRPAQAAARRPLTGGGAHGWG